MDQSKWIETLDSCIGYLDELRRDYMNLADGTEYNDGFLLTADNILHTIRAVEAMIDYYCNQPPADDDGAG